MQIFEQSGALVVKAPAKLNPFLEVHGRRADGYHDIETVMQTISLWDDLTLERSAGGVRLVTDSPEVPPGGDNLAVKAAEMLRERAGCRLGATIRLVKRIPVGSGMGGGSSDAAAALVGLNRLWGLDLPLDALHGLAASLGSDVAFFLYGGTALCRGRGERVARLPGVPQMTYVVVAPAIRVSTREIYENLPPTDLTKDLRKTKLFLEQMINGGRPGTLPSFFNRLASVTVELYEPLKHLARRMTQSGLVNVTMTGSGSAFFGIPADRKEARGIVETLTGMRVGKVFIAQSVT